MTFKTEPCDTSAETAGQELDSKALDKALIEALAAEAGISLNGFRSDENLDTYFEFSLDGSDSGFIAKGLGDPGVRVGGLVPTTQPDLDDFLFFEYLADRCALRGVSLTRHTDGLKCAWSLESVVYSTGLNAPTLRQVCASLVECADLVRKACAGRLWLHLHALEMSAQQDYLPS